MGEKVQMRKLCVLLYLALGFPAVQNAYASAEDDKKACIVDAAQKLPVIAGLQIAKATAAANTHLKGGEMVWQVDIDFSAAGQDVRWTYLCVMMPDGNPRAQRTK